MTDQLTTDPAYTTGVGATTRFAGFGRRLAANLLDMLVLIPLWGAASYFTTTAPDFTIYLILSVLLMLYKPAMEALFGATVGKMILKCKVLTDEGQRIGWSHAILRAIPWLIGGLIGIYFTHLLFRIPGYTDIEGYMDGQLFMQEVVKRGDWKMMNSVWQGLAGLLPLVSALLILATAKKQAAHDLLGETIVVRTDAEIPGM